MCDVVGVCVIVLVCLATWTNAIQENSASGEQRGMIQDSIKPLINLRNAIKRDRMEIKREGRKIRKDTSIVPHPKSFHHPQGSRREYHTRNDTLPVFSKWTAWSRCVDCHQRRMRSCVKPNWCDSRTYEERVCDSRKCRRKTRKRGDFHVVHFNKNSNYLLKQAPSDIWSRWQDWSQCSPKCKSYRVRYCKKPGRCRKDMQVQNAYCYFRGSQCEQYVLSLTDTRRYSDNRRYEYGNETQPIHRKTRKKCGRRYKTSRMLKIIGGVESKKNKWPWHVAILNMYNEVFCGGTLIAPKWVLTASHCIRSTLKVKLNEHDLSYNDGREIQMKVFKMFPHPNFNSRTVDNDIALLLLPKAVNLPVACLPKRRAKAGEQCSVMGWGKLNSFHKYGTSILNEAKLPIIQAKTCRRSYRQFHITENMLCAGWMSGKMDTCAGDSGGGLMCPVRRHNRTIYRISGITSFGDGCGKSNKFGIYTTVFNYVPWINYVIEHYS